jgi:hypothetical protein
LRARGKARRKKPPLLRRNGKEVGQSKANQEPTMSRDQHEIWNPFGERVDGLSAKERADIERGQAWAYYLNGGGGDPRYFDYHTYIRGVERQQER